MLSNTLKTEGIALSLESSKQQGTSSTFLADSSSQLDVPVEGHSVRIRKL